MRRCHPGPPFLLTSAERDQEPEGPADRPGPSHGQTVQAYPPSGPPVKWLRIGGRKTETMATSCLAIPLMQEGEGEDIGLEAKEESPACHVLLTHNAACLVCNAVPCHGGDRRIPPFTSPSLCLVPIIQGSVHERSLSAIPSCEKWVMEFKVTRCLVALRSHRFGFSGPPESRHAGKAYGVPRHESKCIAVAYNGFL
ncbi:hypothetical protein JOQ06_004612 [Pogonophryne albipinna]|uniref:Uncharacterized protein n=1 Tax=Pogonophryne albipinna TaxID=1090488 RepID=A0AAD6FBV3_9TELE|nr:hypothetical protein JOQ06_004612 [Pogonophryne albipinna]